MSIKNFRLCSGIILILTIIVTGCVKPDKPLEKADPIANIKKSLLATIEHPNIPAPEFEFKDISGRVIKSSDLRNKVYIIQGFTYGCSSCERETATMNKVYSEFKDNGIEIISIDINGESDDFVRETKEKYNGGDWVWAVDRDNLGVKLGMRSLEATYLVDKNGIIVYADEILTDSEVLKEEVKKVI